MELEAQDGTKLILLMVAGAIFAAVGLWLLLRPKPSGSAAKIELFGMKFESSSAGVLVFLIGSAFLVIPLFVEEKAVEVGSVLPSSNGRVEGSFGNNEAVGDSSQNQPASDNHVGTAALILPPDPQVDEIEPNNRVQEAKQTAIGQTVAGHVKSDDTFDWFVVPLPENPPRYFEIKVRASKASPGASVAAEVFNAREMKLGSLSVGDGVDYLRVEPGQDDRLYVRMVYRSSFGGSVDYEWTLLPDPNE